MTLAVQMTAIIVGIVAYGLGKLSVYLRQDDERDPALPEDPAMFWEPRRFELWTKAQENEVAAERAVATLIATLSLASIAGVAALGQLNIIGNRGVVALILGFFFPVIFCIASMQWRQLLLSDRARRLQDAFDLNQPIRRLPRDRRRQFLASALPKLAGIMFMAALTLTAVTLPASSVNCASPRAEYTFDQLLCSGFIQALAHRD